MRDVPRIRFPRTRGDRPPPEFVSAVIDYDGTPSWSPDGGRIAFSSARDGNSEIYVMNADGSGQTRLTDDPENDREPSWAPQNVPGSRATPAP